jgi:hypothetical protein
MIIKHKLQHTLRFNSPNIDTTSWHRNIDRSCVNAAITSLIGVIMWSLDTPVTASDTALAAQLHVRMRNREKL